MVKGNIVHQQQPQPDDIIRLVRRCLAGDETGMRELVNRYREKVFGICYRMLGQRQDAEDAAQETFVRALRYLHKWDHDRDFEPWLFTIAGNRCRSFLAKRARKPRSQPLDDEPADPAIDSVLADQLAEEVALALTRIRREYRQAFLLFHEQHLNYAEIAAAMNCPLGTVKTWVHRARRQIVRWLLKRNVIEVRDYALWQV
jgi:RNA polymerase sigma-70 factor (ECF subfamily)